MATIPPGYGDLGKSARDLFSKGYNYGKHNLEVKTKSTTGIEFKATANSNHDSGKFGGNLETKYKCPDYSKLNVSTSTRFAHYRHARGNNIFGLHVYLFVASVATYTAVQKYGIFLHAISM